MKKKCRINGGATLRWSRFDGHETLLAESSNLYEKKSSPKSIAHKTSQTRRKYDDAFKQQALQLIRLGQSVPSVAQTLGVEEGLLYKWNQAQRPAAQEQELEQVG